MFRSERIPYVVYNIKISILPVAYDRPLVCRIPFSKNNKLSETTKKFQSTCVCSWNGGWVATYFWPASFSYVNVMFPKLYWVYYRTCIISDLPCCRMQMSKVVLTSPPSLLQVCEKPCSAEASSPSLLFLVAFLSPTEAIVSDRLVIPRDGL